MIFHGPPRVGKTTAARAFAHAVLGEGGEASFHELDVYDDRSPAFLRTRVVPLLERPPVRGHPFRIVFPDEADTLGIETQSRLRPALELTSARSLFVLACNDLGRLTDPVRSRCAVLRFGPVDDGAMDRIVVDWLRRVGRELPAERRARIVERAGGGPREAMKSLLGALAAGGTSAERSAAPL